MGLHLRIRCFMLLNRKPAGTPISLHMNSTVSGISSESSLGPDAPR